MQERPKDNNLTAAFDEPGSEFHILVHDVSRLLTTLFDKRLKPADITRAQWWALNVLAISEGELLTQSALADRISSTKASTGKIITKLEKLGLVERIASLKDKRAHYLKVTSDGLALLENTFEIELGLASDIIAGISKEELDIICKTLLKAKDNIFHHVTRNPGVVQTSHLIEKLGVVKGKNHPNFVGFLIHDVARMRQTIMDKSLQPQKVTRSQWWVLSYLTERDGMTQIALARDLDISRSALGALIQKLEERKLIKRLQDPEDARKSRIIITKLGKARVNTIRSTSSKVQDFVLTNISVENLCTSTSILNLMKANIIKSI